MQIFTKTGRIQLILSNYSTYLLTQLSNDYVNNAQYSAFHFTKITQRVSPFLLIYTCLDYSGTAGLQYCHFQAACQQIVGHFGTLLNCARAMTSLVISQCHLSTVLPTLPSCQLQSQAAKWRPSYIRRIYLINIHLFLYILSNQSFINKLMVIKYEKMLTRIY